MIPIPKSLEGAGDGRGLGSESREKTCQRIASRWFEKLSENSGLNAIDKRRTYSKTWYWILSAVRELTEQLALIDEEVLFMQLMVIGLPDTSEGTLVHTAMKPLRAQLQRLRDIEGIDD